MDNDITKNNKPKLKIEKVTKNPPRKVTCQKPEEPKEKTRIIITKINRNKEAEEKLQEVEESLARDYQKITQVIIEEINKYATTDEQKLRALVAWFQKKVCYWDNYPRSIDGIKTAPYTAIIDGIKIDYPYRSKESVIVNGFGICADLSKAFKDIAKRMGIKVHTISNTYHVWLVWRSEKGLLHLDLSQAIPHLKTQSPENKNATREVIPIDPELAEVSILKTLEEIKRFKSPKSYSHDNGKIYLELPNVGNNF